MYRLTDIWGNTRVTYADDNGDGVVGTSEIRREQNYYPGGLEHRGYNGAMSGVKNNLKTYQGQEFTEDLGLNTHEWRYRISDPATLRFWQIDPLAEDYYYNATYAFAENKLGMGTELEGAEIHTWLQQKAVEDAVRNPSGVGAHTIGVSQGLANTVTDVVDAVSNPVQTLKGAGNAALWLAVGSQFSEQVDGALGTNSSGAGDAILNSVVQGGNNLINGNGIERGTTIGEIGGAALGTKGLNATFKGAATILKGTKAATTTTALANYYPANNGALGRVTTTTLEVGQQIDRFGNLGGKYFSPTGTPLLKRALPAGANTSIYNSFEVTKPFSVQQSTVAPAFGKVGTGTQYFSPFLNAEELLKGGFIKSN
ncbi:TNT domain-containing protein [Sinomicrobium kalidii]|uniref:glycohydrolase toxin TNT-related protein n=1 Tax=Sinomicrobium kalidii TaxID=2900738 RepID=UPI001E3A728A|nr:glycohydrolase toxin TNT-related protein [Sinomicrobium kalidii]UGU17928.1 TNT domain-containing protein [Sinomicrobium kalidii]